MRILTALLLATGLTSASAALAQDDEARIHFEAGSLHYQEANYEDALEEFTRAHELSNRPALLFNMSQCYERLGNLEDAISTLERYIEESSDVEEKARQQRRLPNLQRRYEDEQAAEAARAEATAASDAEEAADDGASDSPPPLPREPPSRGLRNAGIAMLSVGGAGLLMFAVSGSLALSSAGELDDTCAAMGPNCSEDEIAPLETRMLVADIGLGIGLAAATAGLIMVIVGRGDDDEDDSTARLTPLIGRQGGGAAMSLDF